MGWILWILHVYLFYLNGQQRRQRGHVVEPAFVSTPVKKGLSPDGPGRPILSAYVSTVFVWLLGEEDRYPNSGKITIFSPLHRGSRLTKSRA